MALTTKDLVKIEQLVRVIVAEEIDSKTEPKFAAIRQDISSLKELVLEMHHVLTVEFPLLSKRVDRLEVHTGLAKLTN